MFRGHLEVTCSIPAETPHIPSITMILLSLQGKLLRYYFDTVNDSFLCRSAQGIKKL
jgi:hypothetical protein